MFVLDRTGGSCPPYRGPLCFYVLSGKGPQDEMPHLLKERALYVTFRHTQCTVLILWWCIYCGGVIIACEVSAAKS